MSKPTLCIGCGKPHGLRDEDAGTDREIQRLCRDCFEKHLERRRPTLKFWPAVCLIILSITIYLLSFALKQINK